MHPEPEKNADTAIAAPSDALDRVDDDMLSVLYAKQISAVSDATPALALGNIAITLILLAICVDMENFNMIVLWAGALNFFAVCRLVVWLDRRKLPVHRSATPDRLNKLIANSLIFGLFWGLMPILVMPQATASIRMIGAVEYTGIICVTGFMLTILPQALIAFLLPTIAGGIFAAYALPSMTDTIAALSLLACFSVIIFTESVRRSFDFVSNFKQEATVRSQRDIIGLLLKEFEENASDWLWEFDSEGKIDRVSDRFASVTHSDASLEGQDFIEFLATIAGRNNSSLEEIRFSIEDQKTFKDLEIRVLVGDQEQWWRLTGKPIYSESGSYRGYVGTASDITAKKFAERQISFLAHNDPLTGLLNRAKFTEHLKHCVARLERYGSPFAVLYMDLDNFKSVNDTRGHLVGDSLLSAVAKRIRTTLRGTENIARLGGDEFAIIIQDDATAEELEKIAKRLIAEVSKPYEIDGETVLIGISIGIAIAPINGTRPDQLLRNADLALYRAKAEGRGLHCFFESRMDTDLREKRMLESELRKALENGELELYFQPLIGADSQKPMGFEALIRWNHPIRGIVTPSEFIPIAELGGMICEIGDWTVREACRIAATWTEDLTVAVNLSARHFQSSDIVETVSSALKESGLPAHCLEIEVTESLLIKNQEEVRDRLSGLKKIGVNIALDDFGTGYSSLSYLLKFPFDKIKIDRSFVMASSEDLVAQDILRTIASLGQTLQMTVTAEGVETPEQAKFLSEIACNQLQGFFFSKPMDQTAVAAYLLKSFIADKQIASAPEIQELKKAV